MYRYISRNQIDLILPLHAEGIDYGVYTAKESKIDLEHWKTVHPLLENLAQKIADHIHILEMLEVRHRQEQIAEIGLMAAQLAHEIKNPLGGIYGAVQLLKDEDPENPFIEIISKDSLRLNDIVQRFLDFAKPQKLNQERFYLNQWLETYVKSKMPLGQPITFTLPDIDQKILLDKSSLEDVLDNLIQNSFRHSKRNESELQMHIEVLINEGTPLIIFKNNGDSISLANQKRLFKPFFSTHSDGNGLGLAHCQKVLHQQKANLSYIDQSEGAQFNISFNS